MSAAFDSPLGPLDATLSSLAGEASTGRLASRGDRLAVRLYRSLEDGGEPDWRHVLAAIPADLRSCLSSDESPESVIRARQSLSAAVAALGRFPSRRNYDCWRSDQPDPTELASATFIRKAYDNSWNRALADIGAPAGDITARRLLSNGRAFTPAERQRALELFAVDAPHGERTRQRYQRWAHAYAREPRAFDVPARATSFTKHDHLHWFDILVAAGLPDEAAVRPRPSGRRSSSASSEGEE